MKVRNLLAVFGVCVAVLASTNLAAGGSLLTADESNLQARLFGIHDSASGALTLDAVYTFNFADLGFGRLIFVAKKANLDWYLQDSAAIVSPSIVQPTYYYDFDTLARIDVSDRSYRSVPIGISFSDEPVADTLTAAPEPSTWIAGVLAISAIAFSQRKRLRSIVSRSV